MLNIVIAVLSILGVCYIVNRYKETFVNFSSLPTKELLNGLFKEQKNPHLSNNDGEKSYELYPKTPMSSYAQITNNVRYWGSPCNGTASPADICGGLYEKKNVVVPGSVSPPKDLSNATRVNFYNSCD